MTKLKRSSVGIHRVRWASLSVFVVLAVLFVARSRSLHADAQSYLLVDLGTLGGLNSGAAAINTHGQVVGTSQIAGSTSWHAFSWTPADGMTDLGTLGGSQSSANVVNDHGQVAGDSTIANDSSIHGFSWTAAEGVIDLGTLGGPSSRVLALNNHGQVVGQSLLPYPNGYHAFSWTREGGMLDLGSLGGRNSTAQDVNDAGQVVGYSEGTGDPNDLHAFLWTEAGGMIDLGTLGGGFSNATAINKLGQVVGYSSIAGGNVPPYHPFLWTASEGMIDLGTLGGSVCEAQAISDRGQVVGFCNIAGDPSNAPYHAFSWTRETGIIDLGTLGGSTSEVGDASPHTVNGHGDVVGISFIAGIPPSAPTTYHAFVWRLAEGMSDLGTLGGRSSYANAVNDHGDIIGSSDLVANAATHAVLWQVVASPYHTPSYTVQDLGPICSDAVVGCGLYKINDGGAVSGNFGTDALLVTSSSRTLLWYGPANDVNDLGQVAGLSGGHAVRWTGTGIVDLGPGAANGINNLNQIVGSSNDHAALWGPDGSMTVLPGIGTGDSAAFDINDNGHIVGTSRAVPGSTYRAVAWVNGGSVVLTDLASGPSAAYAINSADVVVGWSNGRAVMWSQGVPQDIDPSAGSSGAVARDVNDLGWAVGDDQRGFAFVFDGLTTYDLNALTVRHNPFSQLVAAWGINNQAQIVGVGTISNGEEHVFLATPR